MRHGWSEAPSVGATGELPTVIVDQVVVTTADQTEVGQVCFATFDPISLPVVRLAPSGWSIASGDDAPTVSHRQCFELFDGGRSNRSAEVKNGRGPVGDDPVNVGVAAQPTKGIGRDRSVCAMHHGSPGALLKHLKRSGDQQLRTLTPTRHITRCIGGA